MIIDAIGPTFFLIANVREETPYGTDGIIRGSKKLRAGKKVYCLPALWGDGYDCVNVLTLIGSKYISYVINSKYLTNWRVKIVYSPKLLSKIDKEIAKNQALYRNIVEWTKETADEYAADMNERAKEIDQELERRKLNNKDIEQ